MGQCRALTCGRACCRLFDLRTGTERWKKFAEKGACSVCFDRQDIPMNKLLSAGLDGRFRVYDARTQHSEQASQSPALYSWGQIKSACSDITRDDITVKRDVLAGHIWRPLLAR